jgi:hypothetical protein
LGHCCTFGFAFESVISDETLATGWPEQSAQALILRKGKDARPVVVVLSLPSRADIVSLFSYCRSLHPE